MEIWKHIIYPFFVEVYATAATPFVQPWHWNWRNTFFGSRFLSVVFLAHPRKNTSTWQHFVRLRIPNLVRISISLAIASPSSCSSDQNWSYHEKKCLVMNLAVLGFLGRSFFLWLTDLSLSYLLTSFSSGFRSVLGRSRSPGFWQWIKHGSCFGGDPFVDFHIIFYEVLLTSRWNSNSRVNPLTKVTGLHWKYGSRGKISTKMIPGTLTTSSSFGSSKKHGS